MFSHYFFSTMLYANTKRRKYQLTPWTWGTGSTTLGSSQSGPPFITICSRNHTKLMNAHNVQATTKQPRIQSANKFSLPKKRKGYVSFRYTLMFWIQINTWRPRCILKQLHYLISTCKSDGMWLEFRKQLPDYTFNVWWRLGPSVYMYVVVNFLSQVIFVFLLFLGMVMYVDEVETKEI